MYKQIMIALDGSVAAEHALDHAIELAKAEHSRILAIYIVEYPSTLLTAQCFDIEPFHAAMVEEAGSILEGARSKARNAGVEIEARMVDAGPQGGTIAEVLQKTASGAGCDMVVMGTHGRRGFQRLMLGSVAESFVRLSACPVMLVPHRMEG